MTPNLDILKLKFDSISDSFNKLQTLMKNEPVKMELENKNSRDLYKLEHSIDNLYVHVNNLMFIAEDANEKNKIPEPVPEWILPFMMLCYMKNDPNSILNTQETSNVIDLDDVD